MLLRKVNHFLIVLLSQSQCQTGTLICQLHMKNLYFGMVYGKSETEQIARIMRLTRNDYHYKIRKMKNESRSHVKKSLANALVNNRT